MSQSGCASADTATSVEAGSFLPKVAGMQDAARLVVGHLTGEEENCLPFWWGPGRSRVDQPPSGPALDHAIGAHRPGPAERCHRPRNLVGREPEQPGERALGREHGTARITFDHARDGRLARK